VNIYHHNTFRRDALLLIVSYIFHIRRTDGTWTAIVGAGRGFLTYRVLEEERVVVLLDLTSAGEAGESQDHLP
jgi:hypothetical protein